MFLINQDFVHDFVVGGISLKSIDTADYMYEILVVFKESNGCVVDL